MSKLGKRFAAVTEKVEKGKRYSIVDASRLAKEVASCKFDETVELAVKLGVKPAQADQMIRGSMVLPKGTGKKVRVLVVAKGEKQKEAQDAGADFVGGDEIIEKISGGWLEFDRMIATPDMMAAVGKLGRILGPRGLMPNPKTGTVTFDVGRVVQEVRAGKVDFRVDKAGIIHAPMGKCSFNPEDLESNITAFIENLVKLKPSSAKGRYLRGIALATTMGPSILIDEVAVSNQMRVS